MVEKGFKRKLAAILSADVEGYSRLMDDDEEATVRTLTAYRTAINDLVQQYRGRVVDTPGDNILTEFASVVDAVNCAVEIQRELGERNAELPYNRKMEFRIGVNLGDVIEEEDRIYGDGVNIAARVEAMADAGGIYISDRAYDQVANKLGLEYENLGEYQVKNITTPIRVFRVLSLPSAAAHRVVQAKKMLESKWRKVEPASVEKMAFPLPDKPSLAVLPFVNMSGDLEQEYPVDGMTEDIIAGLARFNQLFVIARNSTFTYKGKAVKVQQVAEELGVQYVLEGSVQISDDKIRVTAQLIEATTGRHVWVERFDRGLADIFEVQDEVTRKLVGSLVGKLDRATTEKALLKHPDSLDAYGLYLRGQKLFSRNTREANTKSRDLFEKAIKLDPNFADAYAILANTHLAEWRWYSSSNPKESYEKAYEFARKAVALDPKGAFPRIVLGMVLLHDNKHVQSIAQFEEGLKANTNSADLLAISAEPYGFIGQPEEGIRRAKEAMRLNPYYPNWYLFELGFLQYVARDYEGAIETIRKMSPVGVPRRILAACLAYLGRMDEAKAEAERFLQENPTFSASHWGSTQPFRYDKDRQHAVQGYIMAGLPE